MPDEQQPQDESAFDSGQEEAASAANPGAEAPNPSGSLFESLRVFPVPSDTAKVAAYVSCKIKTPVGYIFLNSMALVWGNNGLFLSFPSRKKENSPRGHEDYYFFEREMREMLQEQAITEYKAKGGNMVAPPPGMATSGPPPGPQGRQPYNNQQAPNNWRGGGQGGPMNNGYGNQGGGRYGNQGGYGGGGYANQGGYGNGGYGNQGGYGGGGGFNNMNNNNNYGNNYGGQPRRPMSGSNDYGGQPRRPMSSSNDYGNGMPPRRTGYGPPKQRYTPPPDDIGNSGGPPRNFGTTPIKDDDEA